MSGSPERSDIRDTIFSAIRPDETAVRHADEVTRRIYKKHGLDGRLRPVSQFHVTVLYFGLYVDLGITAWNGRS